MHQISRQRTVRPQPAVGLRSGDRGAAMVEYVMILGLVSLGLATAIAGLGPSLLSSYEFSRGVLVAPIP